MKVFLKIMKRVGFIIFLALAGACLMSGDTFGVAIGFLFLGCMLWSGERIYKEYRLPPAPSPASNNIDKNAEIARIVKVADNIITSVSFSFLKNMHESSFDREKNTTLMTQFLFGCIAFIRNDSRHIDDFLTNILGLYAKVIAITYGKYDEATLLKQTEVMNDNDDEFAPAFVSGYTLVGDMLSDIADGICIETAFLDYLHDNKTLITAITNLANDGQSEPLLDGVLDIVRKDALQTKLDILDRLTA